MAAKRGRPLKYTQFITILNSDKVYTSATIVAYGEKLGFFRGFHGEEKVKAKMRVRHALNATRRNHKFPVRGDDLVFKKGQAPTPGWLGSRWKAAINNNSEARSEAFKRRQS